MNTKRKLLELIDQYAEARHIQGHSTYNIKTAAARREVEDELERALSGVGETVAWAIKVGEELHSVLRFEPRTTSIPQNAVVIPLTCGRPWVANQNIPQDTPAAKALTGPWSLGEMTGNWRDIDLPDHGGVMRIVWKMEDGEGRNDALEAQAHAVVAALNAASSSAPPTEQQAITPETGNSVSAQGAAITSESGTPPAEQQAASSAVLKAIREANMQLVRTGDDAFMLVPYKVATAEQAAPKAAPGVPLTRDQIREVFMAHGFTVKEGHTDLKQYVYDAAHALLELVAAPQQEAQEPVAWRGVHDQTDLYYTKPVQADVRPLYTAPQPAPAPLSERDAFEAAWEKLHGKRPVLWSHMFAEHKMETPSHSEGKYFARDEQAAWKLWQARAALAAQGDTP